MKLEEYILKRKIEDGINEYDLQKRIENTRICVNYIFEYFNNYLSTEPADEKTILHDQKVDKYRNIIQDYDPDVREWLVSMYSSYGKHMHKQLMNLIKADYFLLYDSEAEFRALSYELYPSAVKRFRFLEGQSEMVFQFIKSAHKIRNLFPPHEQDFYISDSINEWILDTYRKHGVNIYSFCYEWTHYFYANPQTWPKGHKHKSEYFSERDKYKGLDINEPFLWYYDYKQKSNLFNIDSLYRNMPKKSFVRGRKQEIEATIMYCWLHSVTNDDDYWIKYSSAVL